VIAFARERVDLLQLSFVDGNASAQRLYAALGFVAFGLERKALKQDGRYFDEVHMALDFEEVDPPLSR
jgi:RimJ/RimL family protein N-acetyltransferase